jgi:hypothetical protein
MHRRARRTTQPLGRHRFEQHSTRLGRHLDVSSAHAARLVRLATPEASLFCAVRRRRVFILLRRSLAGGPISRRSYPEHCHTRLGSSWRCSIHGVHGVEAASRLGCTSRRDECASRILGTSSLVRNAVQPMELRSGLSRAYSHSCCVFNGGGVFRVAGTEVAARQIAGADA